MADFYVKTEQRGAGPFTGIELREAALSGIIGPDSCIGGSAKGPWIRAADVGLFSEKRTALPHPEGTHVPLFEVRGMMGALRGPFKLRELIGFAARGMVPSDAEVKSDVSDAWINVSRIRILNAVLCGDLVLLGADGKVVRRTDIAAKQFPKAPALETSRGEPILSKPEASDHNAPDNNKWRYEEAASVAPSLMAKSVVRDRESGYLPNKALLHKSTLEAPPIEADDTDWEPASSSKGSSPSEKYDSDTQRQPLIPIVPLGRLFFSVLSPLARPRVAASIAGLLIIATSVSTAFGLYRPSAMKPESVIGQWIEITDGNTEVTSKLAVSFRADGGCVVFNSRGDCWAGDYLWTNRRDTHHGFTEMPGVNATIDDVSANHLLDSVDDSDGHLRFSGMIADPPLLSGHRLRDCFLRRDGNDLLLGYPASVRWTSTEKEMDAGWIRLRREPDRVSGDVSETLKRIPEEPRPSSATYCSEPDFHLSKAIILIENLEPPENPTVYASLYGRLIYSDTVTAAYLLEHFGLPDDARPALPIDVPKIKKGPDFSASQMLRYGRYKFLVSAEGQLQYVSLLR